MAAYQPGSQGHLWRRAAACKGCAPTTLPQRRPGTRASYTNSPKESPTTGACEVFPAILSANYNYLIIGVFFRRRHKTAWRLGGSAGAAAAQQILATDRDPIAYLGGRPDTSRSAQPRRLDDATSGRSFDPKNSAHLGVGRSPHASARLPTQPCRNGRPRQSRRLAARRPVEPCRPSLCPGRPGRQCRAASQQHQAADRRDGGRDQTVPAARRHRDRNLCRRDLLSDQGRRRGDRAARSPANSATTPARSTKSRSNPTCCFCSTSRATTRALAG